MRFCPHLLPCSDEHDATARALAGSLRQRLYEPTSALRTDERPPDRSVKPISQLSELVDECRRVIRAELDFVGLQSRELPFEPGEQGQPDGVGDWAPIDESEEISNNAQAALVLRDE